MSLREFMAEATSREAQLALSYIVWPEEAPDPRLLDEWLRREEAGLVTAASLGKGDRQATQPGRRNGSMTRVPPPA